MERSDLKNYRALVQEVRQLREQLTALETSLYSPKSQRLSHTPAASGHVQDLSGAVARHLELEAHYQERLAARESWQLVIEHAIESLQDPGERMVMRYRYIEGRGWSFIMAALAPLGYSERQVYRMHGYALLKLKEV